MAYHSSTTCDRCGREITAGSGSYLAAPRDVYLLKARYDLCNLCVKNLATWVTDGPYEGARNA